MSAPVVDVAQLSRVLSPAQLRAIAYQPRAKITLLEGSVSAGKTLCSLWALLIAIRRAPTNGLIVIVGKTSSTINDNVFALMQSPDLFGSLAGQVHYTRGAPSGRILGREVIVIGANDAKAEEKIRGKTIALAYVDEATLLPVGFWPMLLTRLRVEGAALIATTNPGPRNHWLRKDYILRAEQVGMQVFSFRMRDNPSLSEEYIASMERSFTGMFYDRFILGRWTNAEGAIFDMFDPARHVTPWGELPPMLRLPGAGFDVGSTHASAGGVLGMGTDGLLYITDEFRHDTPSGQLSLTNAQLSLSARSWLDSPHAPLSPHLRPEWVFVDPSNRMMRDQLAYDGLTNVAKASNEVVDSIQLVRSLLSLGKLLISDKCPALINELPGYVWDPKAAERGEDKPLKENDDSIDGALRYPIQSTRSVWARDVLGVAQ